MAYDKGDGAYMRQQLGQIRRPQPGSGAAWEISGADIVLSLEKSGLATVVTERTFVSE